VSVLIILARETLDVIIARLNRTLLWSLILVGQHVGLQIFEHLSALGICASSLLFRFLTAEVAILTAI
jgi:hypothetical protein